MKKHILITGSTDGIGKLAALKLAKEGHFVYLHGRNETKLTAVISEMKTTTNNTNIKGFVANFSDLEQVKLMAIQIKNEVPQLDCIINNAGIYTSVQSYSTIGLEMRFTVNYFASYILTHNLLPLLQQSADPRVVNVSSAAQSSISYKVITGEEQKSDGEIYAQTKLAITMWSFYFAEKYQDISVIAVNPGSLLNTKMVKEAYGNSWSSADKGADILYDLVSKNDFKNTIEKYFDNDQGAFGQAHPDAYNDKKVQELIQITNELFANKNI